MDIKFNQSDTMFRGLSGSRVIRDEPRPTTRTKRMQKLESVVGALENFLKENVKQSPFETVEVTPVKSHLDKEEILMDEDIGSYIKTDASVGTEDRMAPTSGLETRDMAQYFELVQIEMEGSARVLSFNLQKQEIQIQEKLAERELWLRRNKRKLKEEMIKGEQFLSIQPRWKTSGAGIENIEMIEKKESLCVVPNSRDRLQKFIQRLEHSKLSFQSEEDEEEDEIEEIDMEENPEYKRQELVNEAYKKKITEISKIKNLYEKEIQNCEKRKLPVSIIQKLKAKQILAINAISRKYHN